jgi:hypothetical protein
MKFVCFYYEPSFDCGLLLRRPLSAMLCSLTRMTMAHRRCGCLVDQPAPRHSLCQPCEALSSSCWWLPPSAGCYWYRWDQIFDPRLCLPVNAIFATHRTAWFDSSLHEFSFRLIVAAVLDQSSRLDILHPAINLECHAKWYLWYWVGSELFLVNTCKLCMYESATDQWIGIMKPNDLVFECF